jgi:hypothetical protein
VYGCLIGVDRPVALGDPVQSLGKLRVASRAVAYASSRVGGIDTSSTSIDVYNIRGGRHLLALAVGHITIAPAAPPTVDALVLTSTGAVAWINHGGTLASPGYEVHAANPVKHTDRLLDSGPQVHPNSLMLNAGAVSWLDGGQRRSAAL